MTDFNRVAIHGRIVKDCKSTRNDDGLKIVKFVLVSNKTRMKDGMFEDESSFFPLVVFGDYAELIENRLNRSQGVLVEGHLYQHRWERDGSNHSELCIHVDHLYFDPAPKRYGVGEVLEMAEKTKLEQKVPEVSVGEEQELPVLPPAELDFPPVEDMAGSMAIF